MSCLFESYYVEPPNSDGNGQYTNGAVKSLPLVVISPNEHDRTGCFQSVDGKFGQSFSIHFNLINVKIKELMYGFCYFTFEAIPGIYNKGQTAKRLCKGLCKTGIGDRVECRGTDDYHKKCL